ncbi:DUF5789 family protein [Halalkalirubrum salinum]|uniref:DUF5789 family protein n=1 Tax=Halalkalirubrum salinum TaxID=2563889 RepID=UPI0010FB4A9E|nr:hypothetical protein [Halalkalirubrum salinum]
MSENNDTRDTREQGIEFGSLVEKLENESYPISHEELLSRYGDHEIELIDEQTSLRTILGAENEREYADTEGVRQAIFSMVSEDAVGREGYSDRGGNPSEAENAAEEESF